MVRHACELFEELIDDAIDMCQLKQFNYYKDMTSHYALNAILDQMRPKTLYRYEQRLLIKYFNRLCVITLGEPKTIYVEAEEVVLKPQVLLDLPFSVKHLIAGYRPRDCKRVTDYFLFNQLIGALTN